jgi:hypothetical protein
MASNAPGFLARLARQFNASTRMGISSETAGATSEALPEGAQKATVAAGCFWGVEHIYRKHFGGKGLIDARVGYIGGASENPSYRAVCSGTTGRKWLRKDCIPVPQRVVDEKLTIEPFRCRGYTDYLRPHESNIPTTCRILLPNARPYDCQQTGPRCRHAIPQRDIFPRCGTGKYCPRGNSAG